MDNRYKIVLSGKNIYKEIELAPDVKQMKVGTGIDCDVRLHRNMFFGDIDLTFVKNEGEWSLRCSDNIYITLGDIRKLMTKKLVNGDALEVRYYDSDIQVFSIDFLVDFDDGNIHYDRIIDTSYQNEITIGRDRSNCIVIQSDYINNDAIILKRIGDNCYSLRIISTTYGVLHNGKRAETGETISDGDFISVSDFFFCIKNGRIYTQIRDGMRVNGTRYTDRPEQNGYPKFIRSTRVRTNVNEEQITILDPPSVPQKPKQNLLTRLLPSMGMLLATLYTASQGGGMIIMSAISGVMTIVTAIIGVITGKKEYKEKIKTRIESYNSYIGRKTDEIEQCREKELESLNDIYISQSSEIENFECFSPNLFDRRKEDSDFLSVRLGEGEVASRRVINYKKQEKLEIDDELQKIPGELCEKYKKLSSAPIICNLKDVNGLGIVGEEPLRYDFLKNIVIDIIARQYESDLKLIFVALPEHKERVLKFKYLPQVWSDTINSRLIVSNDESKNLVFEYLYKELTLRKQSGQYETHIVVFMYDEYGLQNHPISKFIDKAGEIGISFVFFSEKLSLVPQGCTKLITIEDTCNAKLIDARNKLDALEFEYPRVSEQELQDIVDTMAPVYTEELSLEGSLTKNFSIFEMLNIMSVDDLDIGKRWSATQVYKSMAAPLGISKSGIVYLDLHDKAHGPHGLVAGTTGSGKSEILQTYILSMATLFSPYEVGFVIIDFKGGGMVNQFRTLPHLIGAITNIDGKEIDRSLKSIKAELQKRQKLFAEAEVNHIDKYIIKFNKGEVSQPLPHLIIIVDEFAELKAEQPEFMKELISAARIGRSLGVHLILATQKPSGQVNEQIWSNSRFKLCLKVQDQSDSNEVIKSPLAAEIKEPGRAYLQVGNNEIFELFQSAYSGGPEKTDDSNVKEFSIYNIAESGKRTAVYTQKKAKDSKSSVSQLDAIVQYVSQYCANNSIVKLPDICLPPLKDIILFPEDIEDYDMTTIPLGVYDDPYNQYQGYARVNLREQNALVIGSSTSGKTNLLQIVIRAITQKYSPRDINIYIADFGAMYLKNYEELCHVGGVVTISDTEKIKNLFKLLLLEIQSRKEKFKQSGLSSYTSYLEAGYTEMPQVIFMLDNFTAFKEVYGDAYEEQLLYILREGISCGVTVIITNVASTGIGYKYMSNISQKLVFKCNDSGEYSNIFERNRMQPSDNIGRAIINLKKEVFELQTYLAFQGEKEIDRSKRVKDYICQINQRYSGEHARLIPNVPEKVSFKYIEQNYHIKVSNYSYPIGIEYEEVDVQMIDTSKCNEICIVSNNVQRKTEITEKIINIFRHYCLEIPIRMYIIDNPQRPLKMLANHPTVVSYTIDFSKIDEMLTEIKDEIEERFDEMNEESSHNEGYEHIIFIINNNDVLSYVSDDSILMKLYNSYVHKYSNTGISFWYTNIEDANVSYSAPELLKSLKNRTNIITEGNLSKMKFYDVPSNVARKYKLVNQGDIFYITEEDAKRIRLLEE